MLLKLLSLLHIIFNLQTIPKKWKSYYMIFIPKNNGNIFGLSSLPKIFKKILNYTSYKNRIDHQKL